MTGEFMQAMETIQKSVAGKSIKSMTPYMDAFELHFDDGSSLFVELKQLEDAYVLDISFRMPGSAEVSLPW